MTRTLSSGRNLEGYEREARCLLHDLRRLDASAVARYFSFDPLAGIFRPGLSDARYVVARQYGFKSWRELKRRVVSAEQDPL